ncbi:MAG: LysR family transcriptional regulator [Archangium sp.]|nr:LysR family transcriptional regulator [Archangium sp.]MDP3153759.1 LysR family transcriptional regulator [Archangium sp.]MDP3575682.1 LysR family transcriptional regulator [Archangium sp.]
MNITLDQARTLDAFSREGTLQAAARKLHKGHPAVLYALKQLELQTGLALFDRTGYRTRLTSAGDAVLRHCRVMLEAERALEATCTVLQSGWEPVLRVVFDAIVPLAPVLEVVKQVREQGAPTKVMLSVDSLSGVEQRFTDERAQVMVSVLPHTPLDGLTMYELPRLKARLVAHRRHPLSKRARVTREELSEHVLLTVRGSDPRLHLATAELDTQSTVHLPDFHSKKAAILDGIGFGWLPEWLIERELEKGELRPLQLARGAVHVFEPRVFTRGPLGRAGAALLHQLLNP